MTVRKYLIFTSPKVPPQVIMMSEHMNHHSILENVMKDQGYALHSSGLFEMTERGRAIIIGQVDGVFSSPTPDDVIILDDFLND